MKFTNLTRHTEIGANCYCLEIAGKRLILDAGMHPKHEGDDALPNLEALPADSIDAILISHAHLDHIGTLPVVMRQQRGAPVFMTEPTARLTDIVLHNSINVMTRQRETLGIATYPLFGHREADIGAKRWRRCPLNAPISIEGERVPQDDDSELSFEFFDAGHILGSAGILIRAGGKRVFYSGDVNFDDQTVSAAATFPDGPFDVLIVETTRGDRDKPLGFDRGIEELRLARAINDAFERGGCVLIPVFAMGKTQEFLAMMFEFRMRGILERAPVFIGGLSSKMTEAYDAMASSTPRQHHDLQLKKTVKPHVVGGSEIEATIPKPGCIYALSSGMMTEKTLSNIFARRILSDPRHSVFFVGYADPDSPAGRVKAAKRGDKIALDSGLPPQPLECHVSDFSFSAHASRESIRAWVNKVAPKKVLLVHGDLEATTWFQQTLSADLPQSEIIIPEPGKTLEL